jgi:hypothetical protein
VQQVVAVEQTAIKQAFYNTVANLFLILTLWAFFVLYFVFEQFVRPLLWGTYTPLPFTPRSSRVLGSVCVCGGRGVITKVGLAGRAAVTVGVFLHPLKQEAIRRTRCCALALLVPVVGHHRDSVCVFGCVAHARSTVRRWRHRVWCITYRAWLSQLMQTDTPLLLGLLTLPFKLLTITEELVKQRYAKITISSAHTHTHTHTTMHY